MKLWKLDLQFHANEVVTEYALANIVRVNITTQETVPLIYSLTDVASEAEVAAYMSEGIDEMLRIKNTVKAQNKTADIVMGYDIMLTQVTMIPEILALIDGGTYTVATKKYAGAPIGVAVERTLFDLDIFVEEKDADGSTKGFVQFTYKNCEGKPLNFSMKDGEFFVPEMSLESRPKIGQSPIEFEMLAELPV